MNPIAYERDEDGNVQAVLCEEFRWEEIEPDHSLTLDDREKQKEGFRIAMRAILDILIPKQLTCGDPKQNLQAIGRKAVILAFATRHHSIETKKVVKLAEMIGVRAVHVRKRLQSIRKKAGITKKAGTKNEE